jgi:hypothetical protein
VGYDDWAAAFPMITVVAIDLQHDLDVSRVSHPDYAESTVRAAEAMPQPASLCGWSMGGLVVLQAAERVRPHSVTLLEPSPPAEVQGVNAQTGVTEGSFDPEAVYGRFPRGMRARPESSRARNERKRGISVPSLLCPALVVYGDAFRDERGKPVARVYQADELDFPGFDHCDPVRDKRVSASIARRFGIDKPAIGVQRLCESSRVRDCVVSTIQICVDVDGGELLTECSYERLQQIVVGCEGDRSCGRFRVWTRRSGSTVVARSLAPTSTSARRHVAGLRLAGPGRCRFRELLRALTATGSGGHSQTLAHATP